MRTGSDSGRPSGPFAPSRAETVPAGHGAAEGTSEIGKLFRDLRRCLRLSLPELARRLETRIDVIEALEANDIRRLPPWPETVRIVSAITLLAKIDPRPVLHLMRQHFEAAGKTATRPADRGPQPKRGDSARTPAVAHVSRRPVRLPGLVTHVSGRLRLPQMPDGVRRMTGRPLLMLAVAGVAAAVLLTSALPSQTYQASAAGNDGLIGRMVGGLQSYISPTRVAVRDGLTWIETDDPRRRKGDKLHTHER